MKVISTLIICVEIKALMHIWTPCSLCFQVVKADIFSADSLKTHFKDQDVVMSCLGFPASFFSGVTGYTMSMSAVTGAMRQAQVTRLITMTSWYTERAFYENQPKHKFRCFRLHFQQLQRMISKALVFSQTFKASQVRKC